MYKRKILFLGAAGAGKGTQAARLSEEFGLEHISTGDLIRKEIKSESELGLQVKAVVEKGHLVSDDIVNTIVKSKIENLDGYILDGYPRTLEQAKFLDSYAKLDIVFNLNVPREVLIKRLSGRRMCSRENDPNCKGMSHVDFNPPKISGICDLCASPLYQRKDDSPESIQNRLTSYENETGIPLTGFYTKLSILENLDASGLPDNIYELLKVHLFNKVS
jgi:adenylate kinase